jgi:hypothetical protein
MKSLIPVPPECADSMKHQGETGIGYQVVSVDLKDGRRFEQAIASQGCIIQVRGYTDVPFSPEEVKAVHVTHNRWNFRDWSDAGRRHLKMKAAHG